MSASLSKLTVSELKRHLVTAGLTVTGRKADLVQRLVDARQGQGEGSGETSQAQDARNGEKESVESRRKTRNMSNVSEEPEAEKSGVTKTAGTSGKGKTGKTPGKGNKAETSGKGKKTGTTEKGKKTATTKKVCVGTCKPGKKSGCPIKGRGKPSGHVGCTDVDRMLEALGVNPKTASLCTKAAIMKGHIKITGEAGDLEQSVFEQEGECGHMIIATLGDLLNQPDYAGLDYEDGCENATVTCKECDEGRTYVTSVCEGNPSFDSGKFHNHCGECPGFGQCIGDYREAHCNRCGKHYFQGMINVYKCDNCKRKKQKTPAGQARLVEKFVAYLSGDKDINSSDSDTEDEEF